MYPNKNKNNTGMITVEACLIIPVIFLTLVFLYSICIIQFNNVVTRTNAIRTASRVAAYWNVLGDSKQTILNTDIKSGKDTISGSSFTEHDPYRGIVELFGTGNKKSQTIIAYLKAKEKEIPELGMGITMNSSSEIKSDAGYHLFNRYISVTVNNLFHNPIEELLNHFGYHINSQYSITAKARLMESSEFVRNISFIKEQLKK